MKTSQYAELAMKTEDKDNMYRELAQRMIDPRMGRLLHATMGISTESGELLDAVKKVLMYGKPLDVANVIEEYGDLLWYQAILLDLLKEYLSDIDIDQIHHIAQSINVEKLAKRFGDKFSSHAAIVRDLAGEREILEKALDIDKVVEDTA